MECLPYNFFPNWFSENYSIPPNSEKLLTSPHTEEVLGGNYSGVKA